MIPAASSLVSLATLWTALQGTLGEGASVRGSLRNDYFTGGRQDADISASPGVFLSLRDARLTFSFGYRPDFTWRGLLLSDQPDLLIMHGGYASVGYTGLGYSLSLSQSVSAGEQAFWTAPLVVPGAPVDPTAPRTPLFQPVPSLLIGNETTAATLDYTWSALWHSSFTGSYGISGGLDRRARMVMAQVKTATVASSTNYLLTKEDHVGWDLSLSNIHSRTFSSDNEYWTLAVTGHWDHTFSKDVSGGASLGVTTIRTPRAPSGADYTANLLANANLRKELVKTQSFTMSGSVGAGANTGINTYSGLLERRVQGQGNLNATVQRLSMYVNGDVAQTLPTDGPNGYRFYGAGGGASYGVTTFLSIDAGYRSTWQHANTMMVPGMPMPMVMPITVPRQWQLYFGISLIGPVFVF